MSELIRTVAQHPFAAIWTWIAFLITMVILAGLFKGNMFRFAIWHIHGHMNEDKNKDLPWKEMFR